MLPAANSCGLRTGYSSRGSCAAGPDGEGGGAMGLQAARKMVCWLCGRLVTASASTMDGPVRTHYCLGAAGLLQ